MYKIIGFLGLLLLPYASQSQILIALVFGDKLQSEKMSFGLTAGLNSSALKGFEFSRTAARLKFGLFFNFKLNDRLILSPEFLFSSGYGQQNIPFYSTGSSLVDSSIVDAEITRLLNYFSLPVMLKVRTWDQLYVNVGFQTSLRKESTDRYLEELGDDQIVYSKSIKNDLNPIDVGGLIGFSYILFKGKGAGINLNYYHGFTNINNGTLAGGDMYNRSIQASANIPIGTKSKDELPKE